MTATVLTAFALLLADPPGNSPFDGEWSLEYSASTRPGGETLALPGDTHTFQLSFRAQQPRFAVPPSGKFQWELRESGGLRINDFSSFLGRSWTQSQQPLLRVQGEASLTQPAAADSPLKVSLQVSWSGGSGPGISHDGKPFFVVLSDDGSKWMTLGYSRPVPWQRSQLELTPDSVIHEDLAPDLVRETTVYRQRQPVTLLDITAPHTIRATERIEVRHVRQMELVPRG